MIPFGFFFASMLLLFIADLALSAEPTRKNVLLVAPYHPEIPFYRSYFAGIREACNRLHPGQVEIFQEFIDTVRIRDAEYINHLPNYYRIKYASISIDAVIAVGDTVDQLATRIFPGISVISSDTNNFYLELKMLDVHASVDLIHRLQPSVKKLFVIIGRHGEEMNMAELMRQTERFFPNLEFTYTHDYSFEELISTVQTLPANSSIMFLNFLTDRKGASFIPAEVARKVTQAANCPSYAVVSTIMGTGIVGGVMLDAHRAGLLTGREVLKTLYGYEKGTGDEPSLLGDRLLKQVDEREMLRWGLSESNLPPRVRSHQQRPFPLARSQVQDDATYFFYVPGGRPDFFAAYPEKTEDRDRGKTRSCSGYGGRQTKGVEQRATVEEQDTRNPSRERVDTADNHFHDTHRCADRRGGNWNHPAGKQGCL
jgi:hypothetical protein